MLKEEIIRGDEGMRVTDEASGPITVDEGVAEVIGKVAVHVEAGEISAEVPDVSANIPDAVVNVVTGDTGLAGSAVVSEVAVAGSGEV